MDKFVIIKNGEIQKLPKYVAVSKHDTVALAFITPMLRCDGTRSDTWFHIYMNDGVVDVAESLVQAGEVIYHHFFNRIT